jgi:molybdopterin converting factor small subunit
MGQAELEIYLPASSTAEAAWQQLARTVPALRERRGGLLASINRRYASFDSPLAEGDEVVFIPPVSGG